MAGRFEGRDGPGEQNSQEDDRQHAITLDVMQRIGVTIEDLWIYYSGMGGDIDQYEVDAYLHGLMVLPALARDMISQSVNELLDDINRGPRAPFSSSGGTSERSRDLHITPGEEAPYPADVPWAIDSSEVLSLVYSSIATQPLVEQDLIDLLHSSRQTNGASGITGLLLYRMGRFLQVLEGPEQVVRDRMRSIADDPRHGEVRILLDERRQHRQFPNWTMGFEPTGDSLSADVPGFERTFVHAGEDEDPASTVRVTKELVRWYQENAPHL